MYFYIKLIFITLFILIISNIKERKEINESNFVYTALGDSITFGSGARFNYGYVKYFRDFLSTKYPCVKLINLGIPGITSYNLLCKLKNSIKFQYSIKMADIITIDIGGNNLLKSAKQNYTVIYPELAKAGVEQFKRDWPDILFYIRRVIGCQAPILVMTLYNPYKYYEPQYSTADYYTNQINSYISDSVFTGSYGYIVVNVYNRFEENPEKTWTYFASPKRNPHPNDDGHREIALLHARTFGDIPPSP